jgi:diketogulonate reductase-like aldo/keto reductase
VIVRWTLQHQVVVIPKASSKEHMQENMNIYDFELSQEDMKELDSMNKDYHCTWGNVLDLDLFLKDPSSQP